MIVFPDLQRLVRPDSIAVVGASDTAGSIGRRTLDNVTKHSDFSGEIYLVNARREAIDGRICYPDVTSLPAAPDVALVAVPARAVMDSLHQCADRGVKFAVILTSGFGELGEDGLKVQRQMTELANASGMRIYGPNCPGFTNMVDRIGMTFSPAFADDTNIGPIGIATQGGGLGRNLVQAGERGVGVAMWASLGNAVDLDVADFIHYLVGDDRIKVICTLLEGINDGARLLAAFDEAAQAGKPVVTLKVGHSPYGVAAVRSHTAALAGAAEVNSAVFEQMGVIEVDDTDEIMDVAWLLARAMPPARPRIAVFGGSGGAVALTADHIGAAGLELAELDEKTVAELTEILPAYAAVRNPVDTTATTISDPSLLERSLEVVANDPNVDIVLLPIPIDYGAHSAASTAAFARIQQQVDIPLLPIWMSDRRGPAWQTLVSAGMSSPRSLSKAVLTVRRWAWFGGWRAAYDAGRSTRPLLLSRPSGTAALRLSGDVSNELAAKDWLRQCGIDVPRSSLTRTDAEAAAVGASGERLVAKVVSADIAHKSDVGGVVTGVHGPDDAVLARTHILDAVSSHHPDARIDGVAFEEMIPDDGTDMIVGVHCDPGFGHMLTVGIGGLHVETLNDVRRALLPISESQAHRLVRSLRSWEILQGARGEEPRDVDGFVRLLLKVSDIVAANVDRIEEIDLNPVRVRPTGSRRPVTVLDALIITTGRPAERARNVHP